MKFTAALLVASAAVASAAYAPAPPADDYTPAKPTYKADPPKYDDKYEPKKDDYKEKEYPEKDYPEKDYPEKDYPKKDYPEKDYPKKDYPEKDYPKKDHPEKDYPKYTTKVVYDYTTYCSEATTMTYGEHTYTVKEPGYVSIDCSYGCTVEQPVYTSTAVSCGYGDYCTSATIETSYAPTAAYPTEYPSAPYTSADAYPTAAPTYPVVAGASKMAGAGLAAVAAFVAALL